VKNAAPPWIAVVNRKNARIAAKLALSSKPHHLPKKRNRLALTSGTGFPACAQNFFKNQHPLASLASPRDPRWQSNTPGNLSTKKRQVPPWSCLFSATSCEYRLTLDEQKSFEKYC
jgi:hypothetical protein